MSVVELESRLVSVKLSTQSLTEEYHRVLANGQIASEEPLQVVVTDVSEEPPVDFAPDFSDVSKQESGGNSPQIGGETSGFFDENDDLNEDSRSPRLADKTQICFDFTKGLCSRGDKCKFSHDIPTIVSFNSKEKGICFDYLRNQCYRGLLCRFSHDLTNIAQQYQIYNNAAKTRATTSICYDFVKGVCQRGSQCKYSHDLSMIAKIGRNNGTNGSNEVCHDFLRGRCTRGAACKYSHNVAFLGAQGLVAAVTSPNSGNVMPMGTQGLGTVGLSMGGMSNNLSVNIPVMQYPGNLGSSSPGSGLPPSGLLSMASLQLPGVAAHANGNGLLPDASSGFGVPLQQPAQRMSGESLGAAADLATAWARATQGGTTNGMLSSFAAPQLQTARTDPTAVIQAMNNSMRMMGGSFQSPADVYASLTSQAAMAHARNQVNMQGLLAGHLSKTASDVSTQLAALRHNVAFNEFLESAANQVNELEALRNPLTGTLHRQQSAPVPMPEGLLQSFMHVQHSQHRQDAAAAAEGLAAAHLAVSQAQQQQHAPRSPVMDHGQLTRQLSGQVAVQPSSAFIDPSQLSRQLSGHVGSQPVAGLVDAGQLNRQLNGHMGGQSPRSLIDHSQLTRQLSGQLAARASTPFGEHNQLHRQLSSQLSAPPMVETGVLHRQLSGQMPSPMAMPLMNGHASPQLSSPMGHHSTSPVGPSQPQPIPQKTAPLNGVTVAASAPGALNVTEASAAFPAGTSYGDGFMSGNESVSSTPGEGAPLPFQRIKEIWNRGGSYGEA